MQAIGQATQIGVAFLTALTSILVAILTAVLTYRTRLSSERAIAQLNDQIEEARTARNAELDYRYEARKRVYSELQPLLFQLGELADRAYTRIEGIAAAARDNRLQERSNWLYAGDYFSSTAYRLCAPLVVFRLCQRRLTFVDLSVEPGVRNQYKSAKLLYLSWGMSRELAKAEPGIEYVPGRRSDRDEDYDTRIHAVQHLFIGSLERLLDMMTIRDEDGLLHCVSYGEFESGWDVQDSSTWGVTEPIWMLFNRFHPSRMPVLWRMLIVQAHLLRALALASESDWQELVHPADAIPEEEWKKFDWRPDGDPETYDKAVVEPFTAARDFLRRHLVLKSTPRQTTG